MANKEKAPADRRRGVTFTMKEVDIRRLEVYVEKQQAALYDVLGGKIDRQTVLESLVLRFLEGQ